MKRLLRLAATAGLLSCLFATSFCGEIAARAQEPELDLDRFEPAITHDAFVTVEGSGVRPEEDRWAFGFFLDYAHNPLVIANADGELQSTIVGTRLGMEAFGSVTLVGPLALGLGVPFFIAQTGDSDPSFAGLGDIRLAPKIRILDDREHVGLGIIAEVRAPTHVGDFSGGSRMVVGWPRLVLDHLFTPTGFRIGTNLGVKIREGTEYANVEAASEFTYSLAMGYRFFDAYGDVEIGGEAFGAVGLVDQGLEEAPLELLAYVKGNPHEDWELVGGPSFGVIPGYGEPLVRAFFGVRWTPTSHDKDSDGISDDEDKCPEVREDRNGYQDLDGCPDEADRDGDDDVDGVPNSKDDCPDEKETINGVQDDDGCADGGPAKVIREDGKIVILESVQFETGSARLKPESYSILNQVALVMRANPDIEHLRVEGHTDSTGSDDVNLRLSKDRANAVRNYLIARGVKPTRLNAEGYGSEKPVAGGDDPESMKKNRRVEFVIE